MATGLERIIAHREFQELPYESQVGLMSNILGQVSPDLASDPDALTTASERAIRMYRPRTPFERIGSFVSGFIPIAGPLIQQYGFQEEVPPPALLSMMGVVDEDNPYGGLIRAGLDIPLMIGGGIVGGLAVRGLAANWAPALLNRTLPALIGRELISGAASGTGELVLDPPHSVAEGTARLGLSAIGQAAFTVPGRVLFGRDARFNRALNREMGGPDNALAYKTKVSEGNFANITDDEIGAYERALGSRRDSDARNAREGLAEIKLQRNQLFADMDAANDMNRDFNIRRLNEEIKQRRMDETLREQDTAYKEKVSERMFAEQFQQKQLAEARRVAAQRQLEIDQLVEQFRESAVKQSATEMDIMYWESQARARQAELAAPIAEPYRDIAVLTRERQQSYENLLNTFRAKEKERIVGIDRMIQSVQKGPTERGETKFLQSESQMIDLLDDVRVSGRENRTFPMVLNEPVTLPIAMIQDVGVGPAAQQRAVIVERMTGNRADLRYTGAVDRRTVRLPATDEERIAIGRIEREQGVRPYPSAERAQQILQTRIEAERLSRLASIEARRFNAGEAGVQREIFNLRRNSAVQFLDAHNGDVSVDIREKLLSVKPIDNQRRIASVESLRPTDVEAATKSLRSAGFENVRTAINPDGTFDVAFSNADTPELSRLGRLYSRYSTFKGTFDPTSNQTYSGLSAGEHGELGRGFGLERPAIDKFNSMVEGYVKELRDRGIRFPVSVEAMGIEPIEAQIASGKRAQKIRSEVIANSEESVRRIEIGDTIQYPGSKGPVQLYVANKTLTHDPEMNGLGVTTFHVSTITDVSQFSPDKPLPTLPLTERQLVQMGAKRSVEFPIAEEQQPKFSIASPSRNLGDIFGLTRDQMPVPIVEGDAKSLRSASAELGLKASVSKDGMVRLSGQRMDLSGLTADDAALVLTRLKQFQQDRAGLMNFFGECL